jgi:hypothetical protein
MPCSTTYCCIHVSYRTVLLTQQSDTRSARPFHSHSPPMASLIHKRSTLRTHDPFPHYPFTSGA